MKKSVKIGILIVVLVVVGAVAGPFVYFNFIQEEAPAALDTSDVAPTESAAPAGSVDPNVALDGTWTVADGSQAGYRVKEILLRQSNEAVGRTSDITGSFTIEGTQVTEGSFEADLTTLKSSESRRDGQVQGRILNTARYPTATLTLTQPIDIGSITPNQAEGTAKATGDLNVHGVTKSVTFDIKGVRNGSTITISGSIPIVFADYNIQNPSGGPAQTADDGQLEFAINFQKEG